MVVGVEIKFFLNHFELVVQFYVLSQSIEVGIVFVFDPSFIDFERAGFLLEGLLILGN